MDDFDRQCDKIYEFEHIFLKGRLRVMPINAFVSYRFGQEDIEDFYAYKEAAYRVLLKCKTRDILQKFLTSGAEEMFISTGREWKYPPTLSSHYNALKQRFTNEDQINLVEDEYVVICIFIITLVNKIIEYQHERTTI